MRMALRQYIVIILVVTAMSGCLVNAARGRSKKPGMTSGRLDRNKKCQKLRVRMCNGHVSYKRFQLPNIFGHVDQRDLKQELRPFKKIMKTKCSAHLGELLCSAYLPECKRGQRKAVPPCRSLCSLVKSECTYMLGIHGLDWPKKLKCESFPMSGNCYKGNISKLEMKLSQTLTDSSEDGIDDKSKQPQTSDQLLSHTTDLEETTTCQNISVLMCKKEMAYNMTQLPNLLGHETQDEVSKEINQFSPLLKFKCSPYLLEFLCSLYAPPCTPFEKPIPPCRAICNAVKRGCEGVMNRYGFPWPKIFDCDRFPQSGLCFGEDVVVGEPSLPTNATDAPTTQRQDPVERTGTVTTSPTPKPTPTMSELKSTARSVLRSTSAPSTRHSKLLPSCQAITLPVCSKGLSYNTTTLPNLFGHKTQYEAGLDFQELSPLIELGCSPHLRHFLCITFIPVCTILDTPIPPCRSLCEVARDGCARVMSEFGVEWPKTLDCQQFPSSGFCASTDDKSVTVTEAIPEKPQDCSHGDDNCQHATAHVLINSKTMCCHEGKKISYTYDVFCMTPSAHSTSCKCL